MSAEVILHDHFLSRLLDNQAVLQNFEQLRTLKKQAENARASCSSCGEATRAGAEAMQRVRDFVITMPDNDMIKLKAILGMPATRKFMSYRVVGKRNQRVTR